MKFENEVYDIPLLGRLTLMKGKAIASLMKMGALVLTSYEKDIPLFSYDRIKAFNKDTIMIELFDTCLSRNEYPNLLKIKEKYSKYQKYEQKEGWYDSIKMKESLSLTCKGKNDFDSLISDYIKEFINIIKTSKNIYIKSKTDLNKKYVDDLLSN